MRLLELETENGEMKTLIDQMTREVQSLREKTASAQKPRDDQKVEPELAE